MPAPRGHSALECGQNLTRPTECGPGDGLSPRDRASAGATCVHPPGMWPPSQDSPALGRMAICWPQLGSAQQEREMQTLGVPLKPPQDPQLLPAPAPPPPDHPSLGVAASCAGLCDCPSRLARSRAGPSPLAGCSVIWDPLGLPHQLLSLRPTLPPSIFPSIVVVNVHDT